MKVVINIKIRNEESEYELWPWWWRKIEDKVEINIEEEDDTEILNYYNKTKSKYWL